MNMSARKSALIASLVLAAGGFLVDRLYLNGEPAGPARAQASGRAPAAAAAVPQTSATPASTATQAGPLQHVAEIEAALYPTGRSLTERLKALAAAGKIDPADVKDAFTPAAAWIEVPKAADQAPPAAPPPAVAPEVVRRFEDDHVVTSVLMTGQGGAAVVNGKLVRVGREIDGYRLSRVTASGAVFESGEQEVVITIRKAANSP
jgi:hypothetical protein